MLLAERTGNKLRAPEWLLSNDAKEAMWRVHSQEGEPRFNICHQTSSNPLRCLCSWTAEQLAEHFGIRQQRAMAILALKEREHAARAAGVHLHTDLAGEQSWSVASSFASLKAKWAQSCA